MVCAELGRITGTVARRLRESADGRSPRAEQQGGCSPSIHIGHHLEPRRPKFVADFRPTVKEAASSMYSPPRSTEGTFDPRPPILRSRGHCHRTPHRWPGRDMMDASASFDVSAFRTTRRSAGQWIRMSESGAQVRISPPGVLYLQRVEVPLCVCELSNQVLLAGVGGFCVDTPPMDRCGCRRDLHTIVPPLLEISNFNCDQRGTTITPESRPGNSHRKRRISFW